MNVAALKTELYLLKFVNAQPNLLIGANDEFKDGFDDFQDELIRRASALHSELEVKLLVCRMIVLQQEVQTHNNKIKKVEENVIDCREFQSGRYWASLIAKRVLEDFKNEQG